MNEFLDFAQRLLETVRSAWIEHSEREGGIDHTDESDRQLLLAYVQAHRRFRAIKRLAEDEQPSPEAVMVLTRSLVSLTHRALYLVSSDDPDVRDERRKRFFLLGVREELTYLQGIVDEVPAVRPTLELVRESVRLREESFEEAGWSLARPIFPTDEQLAAELGFPAHYDEVYRSGSGDTHYSPFSAAGGFADIKGATPTIALSGHNIAELQQALLRAIVVYAEFLSRQRRSWDWGSDPKSRSFVQCSREQSSVRRQSSSRRAASRTTRRASRKESAVRGEQRCNRPRPQRRWREQSGSS
jgi:hypothetical protein